MISTVTRSPGTIRMKFFRILPAIWARMRCPFSSSTMNWVLGSASTMRPSVRSVPLWPRGSPEIDQRRPRCGRIESDQPVNPIDSQSASAVARSPKPSVCRRRPSRRARFETCERSRLTQNRFQNNQIDDLNSISTKEFTVRHERRHDALRRAVGRDRPRRRP